MQRFDREADASLREVFEPGGIGDRVKAFSVGDVGRLSGAFDKRVGNLVVWKKL